MNKKTFKKYSVWDINCKFKLFTHKKEAIKYLHSLKTETYLNIYPNTDKEDTILGNGKYKKCKEKRIRLYGCGDCGSEYTAKEKREQKKLCRFCSSQDELEYLGLFIKSQCYSN